MNDREVSKSIWRESHELGHARSEKMREVMQEYDEQVYYPALKDLQARCAANGHVRGTFHDNGLGWSWYWCNSCGASFDKTGPESKG